MEKQIKGSKRGLTFSFHKQDHFEPGDRYRYIIMPKEKKIVIVPSEDGGNTISKKKCGNIIKSLIDLRSSEIKELVSQASYMEVLIEDNIITVQICYTEVKDNVIHLEAKKEISISKELLMAAGNENIVYQDSGSVQVKNTTDHSKIKKELHDVIKVISLFSGAGMLDYTFSKDPNFKIVFAAEYNKAAVNTYRKNIGDHIREIDIRTLSGKEMPQADVIIGGPPCQPVSNANRKKGARGLLHPEGDMFAHFIRLIKECNVKAFLIENVQGLLSSDYYMNLLYNNLPEYDIKTKIVTDCDLGGFSKRKRAIIIGSRISKVFLPDLLYRPVKTVKEALKKVNDLWPNIKDVTKSNELVTKKISMIPEGGNWKDLPEEYWTRSVHSNMYRRLDRNAPAVSIANWRKFLLSPPRWDDSGKWDRILSVSEAAALQGFGKDFIFTGNLSEKQQQVANGVTIAIGKYTKNIIKNLFVNYLPLKS
ncbi:MAG: DNA cytosine methyltransferase [Lachnospiraceae bacterium]|nr:DNA cytosine methyltransferase [Lachnospiraceae bacterium]